jgi:hypothetical protein
VGEWAKLLRKYLPTVKFKAMVEVQEGSFESPAIRETLLDVVLDRLAKSGKNAIFTRIIYVARFVKRENSADVVEGLSLLHLCFWILLYRIWITICMHDGFSFPTQAN